MRLVAFIYLAIAIANLWLWVNNGLEKEPFPNAYAYLTWGLYLLSLLSLVAYAVQKSLIPQQLWKGVFVLYCCTRLYELLTRGMNLSGTDLAGDLNIVANYLWLVLPAGLAMWYMAFVFASADRELARCEALLRKRRERKLANNTASEHHMLGEHYSDMLP